MTAPMSRRKEVEAMLEDVQFFDFAMTLVEDLADEVDTLRGQLPVDWKEKGPRCSHLNCCAEAYCSSDIITKLLELLEPGEPVYYEHTTVEQREWVDKRRIHSRACEIAGRVK